MGDYIRERMTRIQKASPWVGDVRGIGLYYGIELVKNKETGEPFAPEKKVSVKVRERLFGKGIIVGGFGPNNITLGPPLIISKDEVDYVLDGLEWSFGKIEP